MRVIRTGGNDLLAAEEAGGSATVTMLTAAGVPASRATELVAKLNG